MKNEVTYIFDFDKTIVSVETLEVMADIALNQSQNKIQILKDITKITEQGMNGNIPFEISLQKRLQLIPITQQVIQETTHILMESITPSIRANPDFFYHNKHTIYIVSGGFKECIVPVASLLGIDASHVFANTFVYDKRGKVVGFDRSNPLSKDGGKTEVVRLLNKKNVVVIGDGITDLHIKRSGAARKFIAFIEHVERKNVCDQADMILPRFTGGI